MPFSHHSLLRLTAKLSRCLSLALLPALTSEARALSAPQRKPAVRSAQAGAHAPDPAPTAAARRPQPYLVALGTLPLRFAKTSGEISPEPTAPPPPPAVAPAAAAATAPTSPPLRPSPENPAPVHETSPPAADSATDDAAASPLGEPAEKPMPILPDDTPRELRAEDVLPFFRYPGGATREVNVAVPFTPARPQPPSAPPSSATYQQK